jgi:magnesium transporter
MDKVSSKHVSWINIDKPTDSIINDLEKKYSIHPLAAQELLIETYRPKIEDFDDHLYLVLHFPIFDPKRKSSFSQEIDFIIFPYNLITIHYEDIPQLDDFQQLLAGHEKLRERTFGLSSGHLLYHIISQLFRVSQKDLDKLEAKVKNIEEKVFNGSEREVLREITTMRRDLLNFQKALKPQETVLNSLAERGKRFFGPDVIPYFNDIKGEYIQVRNSVEDLREMLDSLYDSNISLLSVNSNESMKVLTAMMSLVLPITLIAILFGMNMKNIPFTENPAGFWIVIGIMIALSFVIFRIFKYHRWL